MKNLSNETIKLPDFKITEIHREKLRRLVDDEEVRADDVLKAGLFLVADVLRRSNKTPCLIDILHDRLMLTHDLAAKYATLCAVWPGPKQPGAHEGSYELQRAREALTVLSEFLVPYSPQTPKDGSAL